jgi:hypothetical protein
LLLASRTSMRMTRSSLTRYTSWWGLMCSRSCPFQQQALPRYWTYHQKGHEAFFPVYILLSLTIVVDALDGCEDKEPVSAFLLVLAHPLLTHPMLRLSIPL